MKRLNVFLLLSLIAAGFMSMSMISDDDDKVVSLSQTPKAVQNFVAKHFPKTDIVKVVKDYDDGTYTWDVHLVGDIEIEFDKKGNWMKVDGNSQPIPESILALLPEGITAYCSANYPNVPMVEVDKDSRRYHVELQNGVELEFDLNGNFKKIDNN